MNIEPPSDAVFPVVADPSVVTSAARRCRAYAGVLDGRGQSDGDLIFTNDGSIQCDYQRQKARSIHMIHTLWGRAYGHSNQSHGTDRPAIFGKNKIENTLERRVLNKVPGGAFGFAQCEPFKNFYATVDGSYFAPNGKLVDIRAAKSPNELNGQQCRDRK